MVGLRFQAAVPQIAESLPNSSATSRPISIRDRQPESPSAVFVGEGPGDQSRLCSHLYRTPVKDPSVRGVKLRPRSSAQPGHLVDDGRDM